MALQGAVIIRYLLNLLEGSSQQLLVTLRDALAISRETECKQELDHANGLALLGLLQVDFDRSAHVFRTDLMSLTKEQKEVVSRT